MAAGEFPELLRFHCPDVFGLTKAQPRDWALVDEAAPVQADVPRSGS